MAIFSSGVCFAPMKTSTHAALVKRRDWRAMMAALNVKLTQRDLAKRLHTSQAFVHQIISGARRLRDVDVALDLIELHAKQINGHRPKPRA